MKALCATGGEAAKETAQEGRSTYAAPYYCKRATGVTRNLGSSAKAKSNGHNKLGLLRYGLLDEPVHLGIEEKPEEFRVDFLVADAEFEDVQRAVGRDGSLIRTVGSGERIENVADGHHLGLHRNRGSGQAIRITSAVEFFMVGACNLRNGAVFGGPRNLRQEIKAVCDMRFDLASLVRIEAAARNRQESDFLRAEVGALGAARVAVGFLGDFSEQFEFSRGQDGWFVHAFDEFHVAVQFTEKTSGLAVEQLQACARFRFLPEMAQEEFHFLFGDARFDVAPNVVEAIQQASQLEGVKFPGFYENFFANSDLAEIVEQRRIAQFLHLLPRKTQIGILSLRLAIHGFGERQGHLTDALRVA